MRWSRYLTAMALAATLLVVACGPAPTSVPVIGTAPLATLAPTDATATSSPAPKATATATSSPMPKATAAPPPLTETPAAPSPSPSIAPSGRANANVLHVRAMESASGTWTFHVTVEHPDTGWEDYADGWDVVTPDGTVLKPDPGSPFTRLLLHPHVGEQPFTRSQSGITIPAGTTVLRVRAHDLLDGFGGLEVVVDLNALSGDNFEVEGNE